ncbi:MAG TPA: DUF2283 domain-containing protein [Polyangiaceae bacterium]
MRHQYLEVTYRKGKPLAAYLYLPRKPGARATRTVDGGRGLRVDYDEQGTPIGIEITAPTAVTVAAMNALLSKIGASELAAEDLAPLQAA